MRVALVVATFPKLSETFIVRKAAGLVRAGVDLTIHCQNSPTDEWNQLDPEDKTLLESRVRVRPGGRPVLSEILNRSWDLLRCFVLQPGHTTRYLSKGLRRIGLRSLWRLGQDATVLLERPDILHFEFGALAAERPGLAAQLDAKLVVSFRGYDINYVGLEDSGYYDQVWEQADYAHFLGSDLLKRARRRGLPSTLAHRLIPPALAPGTRPPISTTESRLQEGGEGIRILSVGRLHWKKGYEFGLQAIQTLKHRGLKPCYRIIGDGDAFEAVSFARNQMDLEDCVELLGPQPHDEVQR